MALRIVENATLIKKARDAIIAAFRRHGAKQVKTVIGHPGGGFPHTVYWAEDLGIWFGWRVFENRYWNAFGTQSPQNRHVNISCEINIPLSGINRRIGAAVAQDERGCLVLVHRGRIGGRKEIGAELFWNEFDGSRSTMIDGDRDTDVAIVGPLDSKLLRQVQFFVREVERIRALVHLQEADSTETSAEVREHFEIDDLGDEFEGTKTYTITRTIDAVCDHGIVVNCLRRELKKLGCATGKDRFRDLYVHRGKRMTSLFEVKPDTSTTSVYTAVGQLLLQ